jgi:dihydrofolate reductase
VLQIQASLPHRGGSQVPRKIDCLEVGGRQIGELQTFIVGGVDVVYDVEAIIWHRAINRPRARRFRYMIQVKQFTNVAAVALEREQSGGDATATAGKRASAHAILGAPQGEFHSMARLVFGMNQSLDGYVDHMAFAPGPALFRHFIAEAEAKAGSLYGRELYEVMRYWDEDRDEWTAEERAFAAAWRATPKWVVSRSLTSVGPNATLIGDDLEGAIRALKAEQDGEIEVGGPALAHSLGALGLIDEYRIYLHPVVVGHGKTYFAGPRPPLRLAAADRITEEVIRLSYVPA